MKTFKEIAKENGITFNSNGYAVLSEDDAKTIAKAYASQAIDKCAEEAKLKSIAGVQPESFTTTFEVDRESILNVKTLLK